MVGQACLPNHCDFEIDNSVEVAQNFKEQGNDYYKGKRYREALGFYSQGIETKPTDKSLLEALLCNRAACNLELRTSHTLLFASHY